MYVITITNIRKKMITFLKFSIVVAMIFTLLFFILEQLSKNVTLDNWKTAQDHPGRVIRVDLQEQPSAIDKVISKIKVYYQKGTNNP